MELPACLVKIQLSVYERHQIDLTEEGVILLQMCRSGVEELPPMHILMSNALIKQNLTVSSYFISDLFHSSSPSVPIRGWRLLEVKVEAKY